MARWSASLPSASTTKLSCSAFISLFEAVIKDLIVLVTPAKAFLSIDGTLPIIMTRLLSSSFNALNLSVLILSTSAILLTAVSIISAFFIEESAYCKVSRSCVMGSVLITVPFGILSKKDNNSPTAFAKSAKLGIINPLKPLSAFDKSTKIFSSGFIRIPSLSFANSTNLRIALRV